MRVQQVHGQAVTVADSKVHGRMTVRVNKFRVGKFRVSAECRQHDSGVDGQWPAAPQGTVAFSADRVREQRRIVSDC
ncbi:hypothetical protein [Streptomyces sp. NBC_00996]|uniref:hypothetical protein n=1 Tax=Streptomyces sp. NBC_00996 TaxID=2903710 RepID=UPI00386F4EF1|nr:hypothetical protein OG390_03555 [Streptomyces sp. NBC_00996]